MAKWQCDKLIGVRLCALFVYAHKRPDMQMAYLDQVLWKRRAAGVYIFSSWRCVCFSFNGVKMGNGVAICVLKYG